MRLKKLLNKINKFNKENEDYKINLSIQNRIIDKYITLELSLFNIESGIIENDSKLVMVDSFYGNLEYFYETFIAYINKKYK